MATNITSLVTILQSLTKASYAVKWTGSTPVGTLSVQFSNDYSLDSAGAVHNAGSWTTTELESGGSIVTSIPVTGNTGTAFINLAELAAYAIRLVYTAGSGTGSMDAIVNCKVS